jgi:hypothetical protein
MDPEAEVLAADTVASDSLVVATRELMYSLVC